MSPASLSGDGGRGLVHRGRVATAGGHLIDTRVGDGGEQDLVPGGQQLDARQQAELDRGRVEVGQQYYQAALPCGSEHRRYHQPDVRLDQVGVEQRHLVGERREHVATARADYASPDAPVDGDQVDLIASPDGKRR